MAATSVETARALYFPGVEMKTEQNLKTRQDSFICNYLLDRLIYTLCITQQNKNKQQQRIT